MSGKMINLWTNFAIDGKPHPGWQTLPKDAPSYAILDADDLRHDFPPKFERDMNFLAVVNRLTESYRNCDEEHHPAVKKLIRDREEASLEDLQRHEL